FQISYQRKEFVIGKGTVLEDVGEDITMFSWINNRSSFNSCIKSLKERGILFVIGMPTVYPLRYQTC
ncbi:hypothetical protein MCI89_24775, partial [Muricomes sp. OA1]|uniref:hypothetical protein n=1 Tax=Muricomes sp. OA1 TaxID=2914165 RepID=UPI001F05F8B5